MKKYLALALLALALALGRRRRRRPTRSRSASSMSARSATGWTYQHDQGRQAVEKELGDKVETTYRRERARGPDAERAIERLARDGCNIIFTTSFGFMDPTLKVAEKFPDVKFEHATGYKTADNVATYNARFYEGRYVIGQIAAKMSKTGIAGYIVSFPIPEVVIGHQRVHARRAVGQSGLQGQGRLGELLVRPGQGSRRRQGAVRARAPTSSPSTPIRPAPLQIAEEQGKLGFGQASDMIKFAPKAQLTAIVDNWAPYYIAPRQGGARRHLEVAASLGRHRTRARSAWRPTPTCPTTSPRWRRKRPRPIKTGKLHPFTGPITKQDGTEVGEAGKALARRRHPRHELVRQGHRRQAAAVDRRHRQHRACRSDSLRQASSRQGAGRWIPFIAEWLNLLFRWAHLIVGIAWIGTSFYFIALDLSLRKREGMPEGVSGTAWEVHGGGFYHVEKYLAAPAKLPDDLIWYKWEAYLTWVTGFLLLVVQYYSTPTPI